MKSHLLAIAATLCLLPAAHAATVYALFTAQNQSGSPEVVTGAIGTISANTFPVAPTLGRTGTQSTNVGGEANYVDFNGRTWLGSGTQDPGGHSFGWNANATGITMTLSMNLTSITDLTIRMGIRSSATNAGVAPTSFTAIDYSTNNGSSWFTAASGTALDFASGSTFSEYILDLTALAAIENKNSVRIRFTVPDLPADTSFRIDNVLLTAQAVPEPSSAMVALSAAGVLCFLRRRAA